MPIPPDVAGGAEFGWYEIHPLVELVEPCDIAQRYGAGWSCGSSGIVGSCPRTGNGNSSNGGFPILEHAIHAVWLECAMIIPIWLCGRRQACCHSFSLSVLFGGKLGITSVRFSVPTRRSSGKGNGGEMNWIGRVGNPIDLYDADSELFMTSGDVFF